MATNSALTNYYPFSSDVLLVLILPAMSDDNSEYSILRDLMFKEVRKGDTSSANLTFTRGLFLSLDKKAPLIEKSAVIEQDEESREPQSQGSTHDNNHRKSALQTFRRGPEIVASSPKLSEIVKKNPESLPKLTIKRTVSRTITQKQTPKHQVSKHESPTSLLVIDLKHNSHSFQIFYKAEGTVGDFLAYMSRLLPECSSCFCVNSDTLEVLGLDANLSEFKAGRVSLEFVLGQDLVRGDWHKANDSRYVMAGKDYWVDSLHVLKELRLTDSGCRDCWYFDSNNYLSDVDGYKVRMDPELYFPSLTHAEADQLTRSDIYGFKIYKNLVYYLETVGLALTNLAESEISVGNRRLYKQIFSECHEQKANLDRIVRFLCKTGFYRLARSLASAVMEHYQLDVCDHSPLVNQFLVQYVQRSISSSDFLGLLEEMMARPERHYEFLRDTWMYEFRGMRRPFTECLDRLRLHNFEDLQDWFFPTLNTISQSEARHIKLSTTAGKNLIYGYSSYLWLFEIKLNSSYGLVKSSKSIEKFRHPLNRSRIIERVLVSLGVLGLMPLARKFLAFLNTLKNVQKLLPDIRSFEDETQVRKVYGCDSQFLYEYHQVIRRQRELCVVI